MIITDYNTNEYMYADQMIRAGGDLNLIQDKQPSARYQPLLLEFLRGNPPISDSAHSIRKRLIITASIGIIPAPCGYSFLYDANAEDDRKTLDNSVRFPESVQVDKPRDFYPLKDKSKKSAG